MRVPLLGGSYEAQSTIANAQICRNLYAEKNSDDSPVPFTFYPTPGLVPRASPASPANGRGLYTGNNGTLYAVVGSKVYSVDPGTFAMTSIGSIGNGSHPVSIVDNGTLAVLVDGTALGYTWPLATNVLAPLVDSTGTFVGADRVDFIDTFLLFNQPNSANFYSTHSQVLVFDPLYVAAKSDWADNLVVIAVNRREIWLLGKLKTEIWYNAGNPTFPFAELPGAYVEFGCVAKYSVATTDVSVYWLAQDRQGQGIVLKGSGYQAKRVSTHAIEQIISKYPRIDDAVGFIYQQRGHVFYQLSFPSGDATWVFDESTEQWHERTWTDANGAPHRHRAQCHASAYGKNWALDWADGTLYSLEPDVYTDSQFVNGVSTPGPIVRTRTWPHESIVQGALKVGYNEMDSGNRVSFESFRADMEVGRGLVTDTDLAVSLAFSDDRGMTYGNPLEQTFAATGAFRTSLQWNRLGSTRDRLWRLQWSAPVRTALNGAWVEATVDGA